MHWTLLSNTEFHELNGDGRVNGTDVSNLQSSLSGHKSGTLDFYIRNVKNDTRINSTDVANLRGAINDGVFA